MTVFLVQHTYERDGQDEVKLIGVYSSQRSAELAVERSRRLPGFSSYADCFHIDAYRLDEDIGRAGLSPINRRRAPGG